MPNPNGSHSGSYSAIKPDLLKRLRRIEGQIRGIQGMVEKETYCVDVLDQISAVVAACEKVGLKVLGEHLRGCVADSVGTKDAAATIDELTDVLERFLKAGGSRVAR